MIIIVFLIYQRYTPVHGVIIVYASGMHSHLNRKSGDDNADEEQWF